MKAGDRIWVHHVSLGYEDETGDIIGEGIVKHVDRLRSHVIVEMNERPDWTYLKTLVIPLHEVRSLE